MVTLVSRGSASRFVLLALVCFASIACTQVLGIEDSHVDPTLSGGQAGATNQPSGGGGNGATCMHFDNRTRVTKLLPNGELAPLPPQK